MTKRRPKGSGTITKIADGRYRARFPFTIGRREEIEGSPFATYEEAEMALDGILAVLAESECTRGGISLKRLGESCIDLRERDGYKAIKSFKSCWNAYVLPWEASRMPARDLTTGQIREWLADISARGLSTMTRRNALNTLRAVLSYGVEAGKLATNVALGIKVKDHGSTDEKSTALDMAETLALIAASGNDLAVCLAIGTGMRQGEERSLLWSDVHVNAKVPHVVLRYGTPGVSTKSGRVRKVRLFGIALQAVLAVPEAERKGIVLPSVTGLHRPKGRIVAAADWAAWKAKAGITRRVRWHDLRHTCATLLLTGAWDGKPWSYEAVKDLLGHSSVKVTERYARSIGLSMGPSVDLPSNAIPQHRVRIGPEPVSEDAGQAIELIERRGWDSNPRMTVLQTGAVMNDLAPMDKLWALSGSYLSAVAERDPFATRKGLDLAAAVDALVTEHRANVAAEEAC
jgi:integrase